MVETIEIEIGNIKAVQCGSIQWGAGDGIHVKVPRFYYRNGKKIYGELGRPMNKKELQERMKKICNFESEGMSQKVCYETEIEQGNQ